MFSSFAGAAAVGVLVAGCTSDGRDGSSGSGASGATLDGDDASSIDGGGDVGIDGDGADGSRLDAMPDDGGNSTGNTDEGINSGGCDAVDFLFVIDNSGSMGDNQQNLVNSFPGFISAIQDTVAEAQDFHVMVVKTDDGWGGDCQMLCPLFGNFCPDIPSFDCANPNPPSACEGVIGAGVTYPIGEDSSNQQCNLVSNSRYITPNDPNLGQTFTCIASVGTDGSGSERTVEALTAALSPTLNNGGGCNEGFLRDEAILVVTVITDEEDTSSPGIPSGWYQNVISRKSGDGSGIVMIGLINDTDAASPICPTESQDPVKLREFIDSFPNSYRGSVCASDYAQVLSDAVSIIDTACDEYVPPAG